MENDFLKFFDTVKWSGTLNNTDSSKVYQTLADLSSCNEDDDISLNYSTAILVFGLITSGTKNNITFMEKFLNENLFCDTVRGAALEHFPIIFVFFIFLGGNDFHQSTSSPVMDVVHNRESTFLILTGNVLEW